MNYSGKIFTAAAALVLCCSNIFAQEQNPQDTTAAPKPAVSENAPMYRNNGAPRLYHIRNVNVHMQPSLISVHELPEPSTL